MTNFRKYIDSICSLTEEELLAIEKTAIVSHLKKGKLIIREGERADNEIFIESGIVRAYLVDDDGNEKSTAFFQGGEFMSTSSLRIKNGVSLFSYEALCDTQLLLFNTHSLKALLSATKTLMVLGKEIKEKEISRLSDRDNCLLQVKATDKYLKFLKYYPKIEASISQRYIASYLGITPVSLSRIKREMIVSKTVNN